MATTPPPFHPPADQLAGQTIDWYAYASRGWEREGRQQRGSGGGKTIDWRLKSEDSVEVALQAVAATKPICVRNLWHFEATCRTLCHTLCHCLTVPRDDDDAATLRCHTALPHCCQVPATFSMSFVCIRQFATIKCSVRSRRWAWPICNWALATWTVPSPVVTVVPCPLPRPLAIVRN